MPSINELAEVAAWYNQLIATNNRAFIPLFEDEHRYLVLKGGGGSGKRNMSEETSTGDTCGKNRWGIPHIIEQGHQT